MYMTSTIAELMAGMERLRLYVGRRLRNGDDGEDIVQETLTRVLEQSRRQTIEQPLAYAFRVADSIIHTRARHDARETELGDTDFRCELPLADEVLDHRQRLERFTKALERLTPQRREAFVKRHLEGKSRSQIGEEMGLSLEAVKKHLVRAMVELAKSVDRQDETTGQGRGDA